MHDSPADRADRPRADNRARTDGRPRADNRLAHLITELQGRGLRVEVPLESRQGGAGPADAGMLWVDGFAATVPTGAHYARTSPYVLRAIGPRFARDVFLTGERFDALEAVTLANLAKGRLREKRAIGVDRLLLDRRGERDTSQLVIHCIASNAR